MMRRIALSAALGAAVAWPAAGLGQETQTVTGELAACYVGQDLTNEEHLACANLCMELAVPTVLVAEDGHVYVPTGVEGKLLSRQTNDVVELQGRVDEKAECRTIAVEEFQKVETPTATDEESGDRVFGSMQITAEELANLRPMSLYEFFQRHSRVRIVRAGGGDEILLCEDRGGVADLRGCSVYVDDRHTAGQIATLRSIYIHEVERLEILRRSEASNRYGGDGWAGAIVIYKK